MKKIRMNIDKNGSENGCKLKKFKKGLSYEMGDWLAGVFLENNWAKEIIDMPEVVTPETPETPETLKKEKILTPEKIKKPKKKLKRK